MVFIYNLTSFYFNTKNTKQTKVSKNYSVYGVSMYIIAFFICLLS